MNVLPSQRASRDIPCFGLCKWMAALVFAALSFRATDVSAQQLSPADQLEKELASFKVPPDWIHDVRPRWDVNKPWSEGRKEIRRLLGLGDEKSRREGIRLTWDYLQKNDIGDLHEYGMYMFLGGEPVWAVIGFRKYLDKGNHSYPPYFALNGLSSLYTDRGMYSEAEALLQSGLKMSPPDKRWIEMRQAEMHDALGDLYVAWGKDDKATASYQEAMRLFPKAKPPYGGHLLPRRAKKVKAKLDMLSMASLKTARLRDGTYRDKALGYSGDINLTVTIRGGKLVDIKAQHQEKIDQNAGVIVPRNMVQQQSLQVDAISGATVTQDAIAAGTLRALKQAGLR